MPMESPKVRGDTPGKFSQVWRYRCCACPRTLDVEAEGGYLSAAIAHRWARAEYGWGTTATGWVCPTCTAALTTARRATTTERRKRRTERLMAAYEAGYFWRKRESCYEVWHRDSDESLAEVSSSFQAEQVCLERHAAALAQKKDDDAH